MHTEHKTLKWCAVLLALIIAIAAIAVTALQTIPTFDTWEEETVSVELSEKVAAIVETQAPEPKTATEASDSEGKAELAAPVNITIKVYGIEMNLMAAPATVKTALESYGIPVGSDDIVKPAMDQQLTDGTEIIVQRVVFEEVVESEAVPFKVKVKGTDELPAKTQKVVQKGQKGEDKVTYKVTYADGKEIARKEIARERVKKPVTKIIHKSTVGTIEGAEYSRKFTVKAYSYTGGGTTASGLPAAVGRIAVDPGVIPLGTRVYVEGYGFATAADTGGNIKGNTIDVYYNSESQCRQWGCRYITIYILK